MSKGLSYMDVGLTLVVMLVFGLWATQISKRAKEIEKARINVQEGGEPKEGVGWLKNNKEKYLAKVEEAETYEHLAREREESIRELEQRIREMKETLQRVEREKDQTIAVFAKRQQELLEQLNKAQADRANLNESQLRELEARARQLAEDKQKAERTVQAREQVIESLKQEIGNGRAKIARVARRTIRRLRDRILFDSGKASIDPSGLGKLKEIGATLLKIRNRHIQVEGHADSRPIKWRLRDKYQTNWELSVARATTVVRYLIDEVGIEPDRLSAAGYAFYQPIASNGTPEGQQENRRVEFVLLPLQDAAVENER
ncbi:MAG: OmpA family protein [Candidatus Binatia bacterium]